MIPYVLCPPYIHYPVGFCAVTFLPNYNAHFPDIQLETQKGEKKEQGQAHLHLGASLDKAKDNEECILSRSDE